MISVPQMCNPWFGWVSLVRFSSSCWTCCTLLNLPAKCPRRFKDTNNTVTYKTTAYIKNQRKLNFSLVDRSYDLAPGQLGFTLVWWCREILMTWHHQKKENSNRSCSLAWSPRNIWKFSSAGSDFASPSFLLPLKVIRKERSGGGEWS